MCNDFIFCASEEKLSPLWPFRKLRQRISRICQDEKILARTEVMLASSLIVWRYLIEHVYPKANIIAVKMLTVDWFRSFKHHVG